MKKYKVFLYILCLLTLTSCGKKPEVPTETPAPTESPTEAPTEAPTEVPTEAPLPAIPYGIDGLTLYEKPVVCGDYGDMLKLGELSSEATLDGKYVSSLTPYTFSDGTLGFFYSRSDQHGIIEGDIAYEQEYYFSLLDTEKQCFTSTLSFGTTFPSLTMTKDFLWVSYSNDANYRYEAYDSALNCIFTYEDIDGMNSYSTLSTDHTILCKNVNGSLLVLPINNPEDQHTVILDRMFKVESLDSVFSTNDGRHIALVKGLAGDLTEYSAAFDLDSGKCLYLEKDPEHFYLSYGGYPGYDAYSDTGMNQYLYTGSDLLHLTTDKSYAMMDFTPEGNILLSSTTIENDDEKKSTLSLVLLNMEGERQLSSSITVDEYYFCNYGTPARLKDGSYLFTSMNETTDMSIYLWKAEEDHDVMPGMTAEHEEPSTVIDDIDEVYTLSDITPGPCPEEFADLRARADAMEEKYGAKIHISDECKVFMGTYVVSPLNDYDQIEAALDMFDTAMAKYPEGFFKQFSGDDVWLNGIHYYITSTLTGVGDQDRLDYAGGFQMQYEDYLAIVMDCGEWNLSEETFHHETSHAIESRINATNDVWLDEDSYNSLNPSEDCYTYSYSDYASGGMSDQMDSYLYTYNDNLDEVYFCDSYSLTRPTEDRARIFQYIMMEDPWTNVSACPHLMEKLEWSAKLIRDVFDDTNWEDVFWERYLTAEAN